MRRVHQQRRVGIFAGPPGIGKSTAIRSFRDEFEYCVGAVSVPPAGRGGIGAAAVLQLALDALYDLEDSAFRDSVLTAHAHLRSRIFNVIANVAGLDPGRLRKRGTPEYAIPLTLVFDEAQNLSRQAIETLRFLNDGDGGYSPFPIGLVFVGNQEFALEESRRGESVLSAAVADRALYVETLSYSDVTDDDLALFIEGRCEIEPGALALLLDAFKRRPSRSFRRVSDLLADLQLEAGESPITTLHVADVLGL